MHRVWESYDGECARKCLLRNHVPSLKYQPVQEEHQDPDTQEEEIRLMIMVYQTLEIVRTVHQVFRFDQVAIHQMMEEMEATQEEIQEEMMVITPRTLIMTFMENNIANHPMIQTRVATMMEEDVEHDTRLLSTINKWAKPLPKLELLPRLHLQKPSKVKQNWELWSVNVALAMSTWNDVAVIYWHQAYLQSEESYQHWHRSGMAYRFAYEKRYLYGRKAPVPATCDQWKCYFDMSCSHIFQNGFLVKQVT